MQHPYVSASTALALVMAVCLTCAALSGCDRSPPESEEVEELSFVVIDSLLGPELVIEEANKALRPPEGFRAVPDSLLTALRERGLAALQDQLAGPSRSTSDVELLSALLDSAHQAGLVVSVLRGIASDDEEYAESYEDVLRDVSGSAEVCSGDYVVNDVHVRNFLVSDASLIRFHLLCFSEGDESLELVYFASRSSYPNLVRAFESSIGTVRVLKRGG